MTKRRAQTATERDLAGLERRRAEAVPAFVEEEGTGQVEGEALAAVRSRRPTPERLRRLEQKQDEDRKAHQELVKLVSETRVEVANIDGRLAVLPELVALIKGEQKTERIRLNTRAKVIIAAIGAVCTLAGYLLAGCA